jgi:two-component system, NarL family, nitrate/nitrite response regulator NarL
MMSPEQPGVRLVVADDHPAFRLSVTSALRDTTSIEIIAVLADGKAALDAVRTLRPEVALLDFNMPKLSGVEVARSLRQEGNPTRVIILSGYTEPEIVTAALTAGAVAFLSKEASTVQIVEAIARAAEQGSQTTI